MSNEMSFETIANDDLTAINGGGDLWDATVGALRIVTNPIGSAINGIDGTVRALGQGHSFGDSVANGLVRAGGIPNVPDLGNIPANPPPRNPMPAPKNP